MSPERIAAARFFQAVPNQDGQAATPNPTNRESRLAPGDMVRLTLDAASGNDMLVTTADGVQLRLTGMGSLAQSLDPGAVLSLRVLATTPRLELALPDTSTLPSQPEAAIAAETIDPAQTAAMRVDQAALLRQVVPARPDAAALASSWHAMALDHLERHATFPGQGFELRLPANLLMESGAFAMGATSNAAPPVPSAEQWLFSPLAYGSHRMMLTVLDADDEDTPSQHKQKRRRAAIALLLESVLPGIGRVVIRMQLVSGGVALDLHCEEKAVAMVRKLLSDIVAALARAGLRLVRCRLMRNPPLGTLTGVNLRTDVSSALALPSSLFRAAAEVSLLLSSPSLPALVNRQYR